MNKLSFSDELQKKLDEYDITIDITPIIANEREAKNQLENSIADIANNDGSSLKALQRYTKDFNKEQINSWLSVTNGTNNATEAIKQYEESIKSLQVDLISLSLPDAKKLINGLKEGETEIIGLIDEFSLLQEVLSDTGNIQQETYEKLLSCSSKYSTAIRTENGRITLNTTKLKQVAKSRQLDTKETIRQTLALKKQEWIQWKCIKRNMRSKK